MSFKKLAEIRVDYLASELAKGECFRNVRVEAARALRALAAHIEAVEAERDAWSDLVAAVGFDGESSVDDVRESLTHLRIQEDRSEKAEARVRELEAEAQRREREIESIYQTAEGAAAHRRADAMEARCREAEAERDRLREWKTNAMRWIGALERKPGETPLMALRRMVDALLSPGEEEKA